MSGDEFLRWASRFPEALLLATGEGRVVAGNSAFSEMANRSPSAPDGCSLFDWAVSPAETVRASLRLWSASGQMVMGPARFRCDGDAFRCEGAVVGPRQGTAPSLIVLRCKKHEAATERFVALNQTIERLNREVHQRKRSEEEIRTQREWLQVTLSSIGDAVIATDGEGRVEFMNGVAEALTGWSIEEARGRTMPEVFDILNEYTREVAENPVARVLAEGIVIGLANHTLLRARDGTERPIEDSAAPIRNREGRPIGVVLVFHDVTEKKKTHAALLESERRFRLWTELNVIAAGVTDLAGTFVEANDALLSLLGRTRCELDNGEMRWFEMTPPEYGARDEQAIAEARQRGACRAYEKEFVLKNGRRIPVIIGFALYRPAERHKLQQSDELAICFVLDITERKQAEQVLERRVAERTAKLEAAMADLEAFSYTVSHDLRAPLRAMQGFASVLLEDHGARLDETGQGYLSRIIRSGHHLDRLIHDVLRFARVSQEPIQMERIDPAEVLRDVIAEYPNLSAPGVRIEIPQAMPPVHASAFLLSQCFANLLGNGIKFVSPGRAPHVVVSAEHLADRVRIVVADNGIGMRAEDTRRLFGIFQRVGGSERYEGTGIGLSVVRRAVSRMQGTVGVDSTLGEGSRFWMELPAAG